MDTPQVEGDFVTLVSVRAELAELLAAEVAGAYLPWMAANARAVEDEASGVSVDIAGVLFTQKPQRYAAKAFAELRRKREAVDDADLAALLQETGCDAYLAPAAEEAPYEDDREAEIEAEADNDDVSVANDSGEEENGED